MNSRDNKIIDLAHTLLQDQKKGQQTYKSQNTFATWRSHHKVDTATVLDTFLQHAKTTVNMIANNRPANRYECVEIEALFFYTARENNLDQNQLRTDVCKELKVNSLTDLSLADYTKIRNHLWAQAS